MDELSGLFAPLGSTAGPGKFGATVVESHISILFFLGERVFKLRKPVHFDFLDFTSREAREADCRREVELNDRFAPGVYLGVIDISADGVLVDHLVAMKRLPAERRLAALVRDGAGRDAVRAVARVLVDIDQYSLRSPEIDTEGTRDAVRKGWRDNFSAMDAFIGGVIDREEEVGLQARVEQFLDGRAPLFDARIADRRIRDGHGDLQAEDIFVLDDGPRILDCIEFEDHLRYGDVLSDLAFLAMDLARLGHPELGDALIADYEELSADAVPRGLANHYCAARAYVRAKVACLADAEGAPGAAETARSLHRLARSFLERARVRLVLVGGTPGTGKSTLAASLGDELDMVVLRSDEVRKELFGARGQGDPQAAYGPEMTTATYATLLERAHKALELGQSVVLDASWTNGALRRAARELADETASELTELRCEVPLSTALRRIAARQRRGEDPSDATAAVARQMVATAEPWPEAHTVDTSGPRRRAVATARRLLA